MNYKKYKKYISIIIITIIVLLASNTNFYSNKDEKVEKTVKQNNNMFFNPVYKDYVKDSNSDNTSQWEVIPKKYLVSYEAPSNGYTQLNSYSTFNTSPTSTPGSYYNLLEESCGTDENGNDIPCSGKVKNQGAEGLCWAYATTSSIETNLLLQGKNVVMSPKQIDYVTADPSEATYEEENPYYDYSIDYLGSLGYFGRIIGSGGNFDIASIPLSSGISPVSESTFFDILKQNDENLEELEELPVDEIYDVPQNISDIINYDNVEYVVTEYYNYPYLSYDAPIEDRNAYIGMLKNAIINYGSIYVETASPDYNAGTCYDEDSNTIIRRGRNNCGGGSDIGHAMSIIGWDDNHEYYNSDTDQIEKGAFILKNSWGEDEEIELFNDGDLSTVGDYKSSIAYSYLAYNSRFTETVSVKSVEERNWDNVYDGISKREVYQGNDNTKTFKYYKSSNEEKIDYITFITKTLQNTQYEIFISNTGSEEDFESLGTIDVSVPGQYKLELDNKNINLNTSFLIKIVNNDYYESSEFDEVYIFTSNINENNEKTINTIMDSTIYINTDNLYSIYTDTTNINSGEKLEYIFYDSEGTEITEKFVIYDSSIFNNKDITNFELNLEEYSYEDYIGNDYTLETVYVYEEDGEYKFVRSQFNFSIEIQKIKNLILSTNDMVLYKGYEKKIYSNIEPSNVINSKLKYKIDNTEIATISDDLTIKGLKEGTTRLTVSTDDGSNIEQIVTLNVKENLEDVNSLSELGTNTKNGYRLTDNVRIDNSIQNFEGTLDGNGYTICVSKENMSIFKELKNAHIKNIIITECDEFASNDIELNESFGMLANVANYSTIYNVGNNVNIKFNSSNNEYSTGGLIGTLNNSILYSAYNNGNIVSKSHIGGIVGRTTNSIIKDIFNTGIIEAKLLSDDNEQYAAGIVATMDNTEISNAYNVGSIINSAPDSYLNINSILGEGINTSTIENAYTLTLLPDIYNYIDEDELVINSEKISIEEMKNQESYEFDFNNIWKIDNTKFDFPILRNVKFDLTNIKENTTDFNGGIGKIGNPYKISTPKQLYNIRNYLGAVYLLENDIDMTSDTQNNDGLFYNSGLGWIPIGENYEGITSIIFDGNNKTIKGLKVDYSNKNDEYYNIGLFSQIENSYIYNLNLEDFIIIGSDIKESYTGSLVGVTSNSIFDSIKTTNNNINSINIVGGIIGNLNDSLIQNSSSDGTITNDYKAGGIIGINSFSVISNTQNKSTIVCDNGHTPSIGGITADNIDSTIENSYNSGELIISNSLAYDFLGGLAGRNFDSNIYNSYNEGEINGYGGYTGGLVGTNSRSEISKSYNIGSVSGKDSTTGGLIGTSYYSEITQSYNSGGTSSYNVVGGLVGENKETKITNSYNSAQVNSNYFSGGLIGINNGGDITTSYNTGNIISENNAAGLIVQNDGGDITKSHNIGNITSENNAGGLIVESNNGIISMSYNIGEVTALNTSNSGAAGLITYNLFSTIDLSYNIGDISAQFSGGLVLKNNTYAKIVKSYNSGNVNAYKGAGGIAFENTYNSFIEKSYNTGNVTSTNTTFENTNHASGIASYNGENSGINDSYNTGNVTSNSFYASGIAAALYDNSYINNAYNIGNIISNGDGDFAKGIVAHSVDSTIENSYNLEGTVKNKDINVSDTIYDKNLDNMKALNTYIGFDFNDIWTIDEGKAYPTLVDNPFVFATSMTIEKDEVIVKVGQEINIDGITINPDNATKKDLEYFSNDKNIVTVDQSGKIKGIKKGNTELTVTTTDGSRITKTILVTVIEPKVTIEESVIKNTVNDENKIYYGYDGNINITINTQDISDNTPLDVTIKNSSNQTVTEFFQIEKNSVINNRASIKIKTNNSILDGTYTIIIETTDANTEITFNIETPTLIQEIQSENIILNVGSSKKIQTIIKPDNSTNKKVEYASSNTNIATVDENGNVTGKNVGETKITISATDGSNVKKTIKVTVIDKAIELKKDSEYEIITEDNVIYIKNIKLTKDSSNGEIQTLSVSEFKSNFEVFNTEIRQSDRITPVEDTDIIKTGMIVKVGDESYNIVISGDVDGNGTIELIDIMKVAKYVYEDNNILTNAYLKAADYNNDGLHDLKDIMKIAQFLYDGGN